MYQISELFEFHLWNAQNAKISFKAIKHIFMKCGAKYPARMKVY